MTDNRVLEQLMAEATCHRQLDDLYRAKMYGLRPTSQTKTRLREPQRACQGAETLPCDSESNPRGALDVRSGAGRFHASDASCADCGLRFSSAFAAVSQSCARCAAGRSARRDRRGGRRAAAVLEPAPDPFMIPRRDDGR